ncbi:MAG: hypothetical protein G01um10147_593 [Microgenomates group bacterium Gr01-1014_7]|nr:MAG: hypothetical protein G01um10147_593 [Microgenomates group bacterium Gr01-1014_7]
MKQAKLFLIVILTVLALLLLTSNNANPGSPTYNLKRLQEKIFLNLRLSPEQKADYYDSLLSVRLKELEHLTYNKKTYLLWDSSLRYTATAGEVTNLIVQNNLKDKANQFIGKFRNHQQSINNLLTNYPGDLDPTEENHKFLTDAINYLNLYIEKLSQVK